MDASSVTEFTTGIIAETEEFLWKIENFALVLRENRLINQQKFEFEIGKSASLTGKSNWSLGLRMVFDKYGGVYDCLMFCKLLQLSGADITTCQIKIYVKDAAGRLHFRQQIFQLFAINQQATTSIWSSDCNKLPKCADDKGALNLLIKFSIFHPPVPNKKPSMFLSMEKLRESSTVAMQDNFGKLLESTDSGDVIINCSDGIKLKAHKIILIAQSPVFASMFSGDFAESDSGVVEVDDICGKTMKLILKYLYTGRLLDDWCEPDIIVEFTYAAGKYQLSAVLEMLDNVLGHEEISFNSFCLLNLVEKLSLKKAEARLVVRIMKMVNAAKTSADISNIFEVGKSSKILKEFNDLNCNENMTSAQTVKGVVTSRKFLLALLFCFTTFISQYLFYKALEVNNA